MLDGKTGIGFNAQEQRQAPLLSIKVLIGVVIDDLRLSIDDERCHAHPVWRYDVLVLTQTAAKLGSRLWLASIAGQRGNVAIRESVRGDIAGATLVSRDGVSREPMADNRIQRSGPDYGCRLNDGASIPCNVSD